MGRCLSGVYNHQEGGHARQEGARAPPVALMPLVGWRCAQQDVTAPRSRARRRRARTGHRAASGRRSTGPAPQLQAACGPAVQQWSRSMSMCRCAVRTLVCAHCRSYSRGGGTPRSPISNRTERARLCTVPESEFIPAPSWVCARAIRLSARATFVVRDVCTRAPPPQAPAPDACPPRCVMCGATTHYSYSLSLTHDIHIRLRWHPAAPGPDTNMRNG